MRLIAALLSFSLCTLATARVSADATASVIVLGLRSVEGDDDVANLLTDALRDAAHQVPTWQPMERAVSMTQMTLAHGCDDVDAGCLSDIAQGLNVELIVYGTVRRTSARSEYDFQVTLSLFDANTGSITATENDTMPRNEGDRSEALGVRAKTLLRRLTGGEAAGGTLSIQVNTSRAEVRIDGQMVGQTQNGQLLIEGVPEGEHDIEIFAAGRGRFAQRTMVAGSGQTNVVAQLGPVGDDEAAAGALTDDEAAPSATDPDDGKPKSLRWLGYTLIGVGGASLVGAVASWIVLGNINGDATYKKYRSAVGPKVDDVCAEAEAGNKYSVSDAELSDVKGMCGTGGTFEVLQWVFLVAAIGGGGAGTYILLTDKGGEQGAAKLSEPRLALTPSVTKRSMSLSATLRF